MEQLFKVGEEVYDDLTRRRVKIIGIETKEGRCDGVDYHGVVTGLWLDDPWVGGGRFPWEVTKIEGLT